MSCLDLLRRVSCVAGVTATLLGAPTSAHARPDTSGRSHALDGRPREILLDIRGSAEEAAALRTTLQELTARRGLACVFAMSDERATRSPPWATLSFELDSGAPQGAAARGPALTVHGGAGGRLRLHRVLPGGASPAVAIETLATIASAALETLAREEATRPAERSAATPPEPGEPAPVHGHTEDSPPAPEATLATTPVPSPPANVDGATLTPAEPLPMIILPSPEAPRPLETEGDGLTVVARAPAHAASGTSSPVRLSLASFTGYRTGNALTGDRRTEGAWGMGVGAVGAIPRWPLEPALGVGLGAWYGTGHDVFGNGAGNDGGPRPAPGSQLQGQAEVRLTVVRHGRLSGTLGPCLTTSRASYDFGPPTSMGPRAPAPNQGPLANQGLDPNASGAGRSRVTRTEVSAGLAARVDAELGRRLSLYVAFAGTTPLTHRPTASDGRLDPSAQNDSGQSVTTTRWSATAFAGLSIALNDERTAF